MGSHPPGTLCFYCGLREAVYIPDGCSGPVCFDLDVGCYDRGQDVGWDVIVQERLMRLWKMKTAMICTDRTSLPGPLSILEIQRGIAPYLWEA